MQADHSANGDRGCLDHSGFGEWRPPPGTPGAKEVEFSDEAVAAAIDKGVKYLYSAQKPNGSWEAYREHDLGSVAIVACACWSWAKARRASR